MLGLPKGEVYLVPWTSEWEKEFYSEKDRINEAIGEHILAVHHIGSIAVKHLSAKPIIDMAVELKEIQDGEKCAALLKTIGYSYKGTNVLPERHYFSKGEPRTHQIHMYQCGNRYLHEQLKFRDFLIYNERARIEYEELKQKLSSASQGDKYKYAENKTRFIRSILEAEKGKKGWF